MSRSTIIHPYEFLVRWREGKISGSHIQYIEHVYEGDKEVFHHIHDPQPVTESSEFPLKDILDKTLVAALATVQSLQDELGAANQTITVLQKQAAVKKDLTDNQN